MFHGNGKLTLSDDSHGHRDVGAGYGHIWTYLAEHYGIFDPTFKTKIDLFRGKAGGGLLAFPIDDHLAQLPLYTLMQHEENPVTSNKEEGVLRGRKTRLAVVRLPSLLNL